MIPSAADGFAHELHMRRAFDLAREAAARGDGPFGSVLVRADEIVMEESNRVNTADDIRRHPELHLASRAARELAPAERVETVMYTSTEPCPMCAGGIAIARLGAVLYSVSGEDLAEQTGSKPGSRAAEILAGRTEVGGPILPGEGRAIHADFGW